ncbi:hypothetical protein [Pseudomonas fluorescens]|uniref:Uncharacterized protein n=1 Tax=Pseudomonas fluorescens TaxID=294 RepID=A0A944DF28_PSEFL|nr:hypothetical protein [Pseudomonas fluorescens]MBT2297305.1 hypothetical protein [Pseudomonas fluorescens]MBT2306505.1 hypothetical protein [Pseudomonas fluorescens]MBT2315174.1 hypothetical protein [Pseudomonas fluorescens]MBT2318793.1 hypothetical protein [Pseudomonas fluorescens]MBT2328472.1 hypothetical protein [Pseudomonas fluorescens]
MTCTSNIPELAAPTLANALRNSINITSAAHLQVAIAPYPGMDAGDLIELFWDNCYVGSRLLSAADVHSSVTLRVPESFIVNGTSRIHYRVMQVGRGPALSAPQRVQVKLDCPGGQPSALSGDENQGLAPVRIPDAIRRKGVNPSQVKRGVPLTIEPYLNMAADDAITLRWGDVRMDLPRIKPCEVGLPINIWVPPQIILEAGEDLRLEVTYCILDRVGNNSHWAPPRTLKIGCANPYLKSPAKEALMAAEPRGKNP